MNPTALRINPRDDVAVLLQPVKAGEEVIIDKETCLSARQDIATGHKIALRALSSGSVVIKYGQIIGQASQAIAAGDWVHSHNLVTRLSGELSYEYHPVPAPKIDLPGNMRNQSFQGYERADGEIGIRNEIWIIPTVGCVNQVARNLADSLRNALELQGLDGIFALTHPFGCSQLGDDHRATRRLLAALARHPNAGGVLILGLGCENNTMAEFRQQLGDVEESRYAFLVCQDVQDEEAVGKQALLKLVAQAKRCQRRSFPVSALRVGLKCGGSDAFSGITANPLVGAFSDYLIAAGGTSVLTEVPEMFGAEHLLMQRCQDRAIFDQMVTMINDFKAYFLRHNQTVYENPSPGNKAGGITTLEEKSLGCTQKGGLGEVVDILDYGKRLQHPGLNLLSGPGNDIVSITALAAAGCQMVLFTTGRGTPLGSIIPTLKISTNDQLAAAKPNWIDFNAGALLRGIPLPHLTQELFQTVLATASGLRHSKAEENHQREIAIFHDGVTL